MKTVLLTKRMRDNVIAQEIMETTYVKGNLAVVKDETSDAGFSITHIPTGLAAASTRLRHEAKSLVNALCLKALYEDGDEVRDLFAEYADDKSPITATFLMCRSAHHKYSFP